MTQQNANNILSQHKKKAGANPDFAMFADKVKGQKMAQMAYETKHGLRNHKYAGLDAKEQAKKLLKECRALSLRGERKQALVLLRKAIALDETNIELHLQMGDMLGDKPETRVEAMKSMMNALRLDPKDSKVYLSLGSLLMQMGREAEAIEYFELAATFNPKNALALSRMMHLKAHRQDWSFWPKVNQYLKPFRGTKLIADPFVFLPLVDDGQFQKERSVALANFTFDNRNTTKLDRPAREPGAKIRIGYFSSDFYDHATMHLMGGIFENHDRDQFEIYVYDYGSAFRDAENQRVRDTVDVFRDVRNVPGETIVNLARRDMLDIAIDLKGHTRGGRLEMFNQRVAPVQITYLGYPGTTGVRAMDYMIGDEVTIPNRLQKHYCEKILYMPNCYQPTDENRYIAETGKTRADHGLPDDAFVFASFNGAYKVTPARIRHLDGAFERGREFCSMVLCGRARFL